MKKILGLDLGVASIGWAIIQEDNDKRSILGMGCRIIPLDTDDKDEFSKGNKISKNQKRTARRTQRKGYDRYQQRRKKLTELLIDKKMFNAELFALQPLELWGLRAKAAESPIELTQLGRVLYHLNQKRGYKSSRADANLEKKDTDYVAEVKGRHELLKQEGKTIGQKFFNELQSNQFFRIKQQVFPREAYLEEFDQIMRVQQKAHGAVLTDELVLEIRDEIIYYQRKLKSQKGLVSLCEFEGRHVKVIDRHTGKEKILFVGPRVAPKSSPLFQYAKIWESINSITIKNRLGETIEIPLDLKNKIFEVMNEKERLTQTELFGILKIKKNDGYTTNKQIEKGLQGNTTLSLLRKFSEKFEHPEDIFKFEVKSVKQDVDLVDTESGEIKTVSIDVVSPDFERQPLYKLWHTIYSISDLEECSAALVKHFGLSVEHARALAGIDFTRFGFGNKSSKAIRKMLPGLMQGYVYSAAASMAGYNHSNSRTKEENQIRELKTQIKLLEKNSLRQPIVEKILNQMINVVNAILNKYGGVDEIRVELARELKQSREERNNASASMARIERENEEIRRRLIEEYGLRATRNNVVKWRLFHEINNKESKANAVCIYCGQSFGITDALRGSNVDVEHIIPRSLLFDDSQSNKTLSHRKCNEAKGNQTAFDYMKSRSERDFDEFIERVSQLYKNQIIGKAKHDKLLMSADKIPQNFIDRQLRETQYVAKKAKEILEEVCLNVWSTSGSVTEYLRRVWGWDDVLMNLQLPKYRELGLTEFVEWETEKGQQKHQKEIIKGWSKRDDHRHHAIDALVIACTKQGFIQRLNKLSAEGNRDEMYKEINGKVNGSLLESYLREQRPFTTKEVEFEAAKILISFKAGKKVATRGVRKIKKGQSKVVVQRDILIPRGALSEESVYGKIIVLERKPIKYLFENPDLIAKDYIRAKIKDRLLQHDENIKEAIKSCKKDPIYLDKENLVLLEFASCYKEEVVIKYPVSGLTLKDVEYIVDGKIKRLVKERLEAFGNKPKEAFKSPLYFDETSKRAITSVRMFTGLSSIEPVKKDAGGKDIGFVKPGNNHHIAFYRDANGKVFEHVCTFWQAVERKKFGFPAVIRDVNQLWSRVLSSDFPKTFVDKLPPDNSIFVDSLQQNDLFVLGLASEQVNDLLSINDRDSLFKHVYRVQKIAESNYMFRHQYETQINDSAEAKLAKRFIRVRSISAFEALGPVRLRVDVLGNYVV